MPLPRCRACPLALLTVVCVVLAAPLALAQPTLDPRALDPEELDAATIQRAALRYEVDAIVHNALQATGVPGLVVAVALAGEVLVAEAYGLADIDSGRPLQLDDPLWLASLTKAPVAVAVLALAAAGAIDLDAPIDALLPPGVVPPARAGDRTVITARHLLTHTSGLDEALLGSIDARAGPNPPLAALPLPPRVEPAGSGPRYNNANHHALGQLIEAATGTDVEAALRAWVFAPLGIASARLLRPMDPGYEEATAPGHLRDGAGALYPTTTPTLLDPTAGQLRLSGRDAATLLAGLTAPSPPGPLADGVRDALLTPAARAHPLAPGTTLGLWEGSVLGHAVVLQPGDLPGLHTLLLLVPEVGLGLFVHANGPESGVGEWRTVDGLRDVRWYIAEQVLRRFLGDARTAPDPVDPGTLPEAARVASGVYRPTRTARTGPEGLLLLSGLMQLRVSVGDDGSATVRTPADTSPPRRYLPTATGVYVREGGGEVLAASRDAAGRPLLHGSLGLPLTLERVPLLQRAELLQATVLATLAAAAFALVSWPIGAWRRWRARRPRGTEPGALLVALRVVARAQGLAALAWSVVLFQMIDGAQRALAYDAARWWPWSTASWAALTLAAVTLASLALTAWWRGDARGTARPRLRPRAATHALIALIGLALALQGWVWRLPPWS